MEEFSLSEETGFSLPEGYNLEIVGEEGNYFVSVAARGGSKGRSNVGSDRVRIEGFRSEDRRDKEWGNVKSFLAPVVDEYERRGREGEFLDYVRREVKSRQESYRREADELGRKGGFGLHGGPKFGESLEDPEDENDWSGRVPEVDGRDTALELRSRFVIYDRQDHESWVQVGTEGQDREENKGLMEIRE